MFTRLVVRTMEWTLISILGLMVILVFGNVVLRYGFNYGIIFSEEVSRFLFVWMVFLGSVLMLRDNGHLGVHTVTKMLPLAGIYLVSLGAATRGHKAQGVYGSLI